MYIANTYLVSREEEVRFQEPEVGAYCIRLSYYILTTIYYLLTAKLTGQIGELI